MINATGDVGDGAVVRVLVVIGGGGDGGGDGDDGGRWVWWMRV